MKIAPLPQWDWRAEVVKDLLLFGPEKWSLFFLDLIYSWSGKQAETGCRPFLFFFLRLHNFGRKNRFNFGEDLFF